LERRSGNEEDAIMSGEVRLKDEADDVEIIIVRHDVGIDPIRTDPDGFIRGPNVTVNGRAIVETARSDSPNQHVPAPELIADVEVQLGPSGVFVSAEPTGPLTTKPPHHKTFATWSSGPLPITGVVNDRLQVTARLTVMEDGQPVEQPNRAVATVNVDGTPFLELTTPDDIVEARVNNVATFHLAGTARPAREGADPVVAVEWVLGDGQTFTLATPHKPNDFSKWTADVKVPELGTFQVSVRARDAKGGVHHTSAPESATLHAVDSFVSSDPDDVFGLGAYLDDLLKFAAARVVDGDGARLTAKTLTAAFHHRFAELTKPDSRAAATAVVPQLRVCVEVLRAFSKAAEKPPQATEEAKYRQRAYAALLSALGTSVDELRLVRGDDTARARLAERLGVDRPDRLDRLMLTSNQLNEPTLEAIFGLQDTTRDPLDSVGRPEVLTWQLARLRTQSQQQDSAAKVFDAIPLPIIDPDLLVSADFRRRNTVGDPAFGLFTARRSEMTALVRHIEEVRKAHSVQLAAFDDVLGTFVAKAEDLLALRADHEAGRDIRPSLVSRHLDLAAFLRLMRIRDLAVRGTVLDAEWDDVTGIAAQVTKVGRYAAWRAEEQASGLTLDPDSFAEAGPAAPPVELPQWRATPQARRAWQATLGARIAQKQDVIQALRDVVAAAEAQALPGLRDLLVTTAEDAARGLLIELGAGINQQATRVAQAIETLQGALLAVRAGAFRAGHPAAGWTLNASDPRHPYSEADFDRDWVFWGAHATWRGAMRVFIYPESHLLPTLRPMVDAGDLRPNERPTREPTNAFKHLVKKLRADERLAPVTPVSIAKAAEDYLAELRGEIPDSGLPPDFKVSERMTDGQLAERQALSAKLMAPFATPHEAPSHLREVFYFVPVLCALQLQRAGEFLAALDCFRTVYAYDLPPGRVPATNLKVGGQPALPEGSPLPDRRQIDYGLTLEEGIEPKFDRDPNWPREGLNPYEIARRRPNALTGFVVISVDQCFEQFADAAFTRDTDESVASARTFYQTAIDLLGLTYPTEDDKDAVDPAQPFGLDPLVRALRLHADSSLRKLRLGCNIAGLERQSSSELVSGDAIAPRQPTPYRYAALVARAKELTQMAAQMEGALLSALEKRDAESYSLLRARDDLELAGETVVLHDLRVNEANDEIGLAMLGQERADIQANHFSALLGQGRVGEELAVAAEGLGVLAGEALGGLATGGLSFAAEFALGGSLVSTVGSLFGRFSSLDQRERDWRLNLNLAKKDQAMGDKQVAVASEKAAVASKERAIAHIQQTHAEATVQFLAGKFTNAELYEFMSGVLDRVYRFFLQQATALAKLADDQLAFERQEAPQGIIQGDYYASPDQGLDHRGITSSARLLADLVQLDQRAFLTDQRRLQISKTFSLARLAPIELELFRRTGVLVFGTPQELFDRDFPGHYLRQIKEVRTEVVALVSPTDGIHATLSTPGTSRVVIGGDSFRSVVVRRAPETVALSSPRNATGLFELLPDSQPELLRPFEGSGVDTVWRFELPKAANQFDFATIADVLLTIEYTALSSFEYRQQVIRTLVPELSVDRPFSFRQQFPDQWYDLNNPDQSPTPMTVRFKTTRGDFLPNVDDLKIQNLVLYVAPANGEPVEVHAAQLRFKRPSDQAPVGGAADSVDGLISTRRPNGSSWLPIAGHGSPVGDWELALPADEPTKNLFRNEEVADLLFVITCSGRTPAWPF
jgi:hypothetical protein